MPRERHFMKNVLIQLDNYLPFLPNLIYLGKTERDVIKKYKDDKKKKKQEIVIKELEDILKNL